MEFLVRRTETHEYVVHGVDSHEAAVNEVRWMLSSQRPFPKITDLDNYKRSFEVTPVEQSTIKFEG